MALLADDRGLQVHDRATAERVLRRTNYYRFTGYSRHFQVDASVGQNQYRPGANFEEIHELMLRDDALRARLFVPLSDVEMSVRTRFAHVSGRLFGGGAFYIDPGNFAPAAHRIADRLQSIVKDLRLSKHPAVAHYRTGDDVSQVPVWVAVEVLSFGKIAQLVEGLASETMRAELADFFSFPRATFPRTLHALSGLRNSCAHHGQLWNRYLSTQCPLPTNKRERPRDLRFDGQGIYPAILALHKLAIQPSARAQLRVVERQLRSDSVHSFGVLNPSGVK